MKPVTSIVFLSAILLTSLACSTIMPGLFIKGKIQTLSHSKLEGKTFFIAQENPPDLSITSQKINLILKNKMEQLGYTESDQNGADIAVAYAYIIADSKTVLSSSPNYMTGGSNIHSSVIVDKIFYLRIADWKASMSNKSEGKNIPVYFWQSEIHSSGSQNDKLALVTHFIAESFKYINQSVEKDFELSTISKPIPEE